MDCVGTAKLKKEKKKKTGNLVRPFESDKTRFRTGPYGATPSSGEESELEHDAALDEANLHLDPSNGKAVQRNAVLNDQQETASQTTFNSGALGVQVTDNVFSETKCELARGLDGSVSSNDEHSPGRDLPLFPLRAAYRNRYDHGNYNTRKADWIKPIRHNCKQK
ncbi:hypothetical protein LY78DRAFT_685120 [Colletotrichum sublineola]|nr:hypothetical protein LY78DRAFT_685120 [Colletotrichum sublineola]